MSAVDTIQKAANLIKARAEKAAPGPWEQTGVMGSEYDDIVDSPGSTSVVADTDTSDENAEHIASWDPIVALEIADWLQRECDAHRRCMRRRDGLEESYIRLLEEGMAHKLARVYLRKDSVSARPAVSASLTGEGQP